MIEPMTPCTCITAHDRMVCIGWCKRNNEAWEYRCQSCGANLADVVVDGVRLRRVGRCDDCIAERKRKP